MLNIIKNLANRLNPYHRYERCHCLTLCRLGRRKVELCYAPADYEPREHVHPNSDGEFLILWAKNRPIYRKTLPIRGIPFRAGPEDRYMSVKNLGNGWRRGIIGYELGPGDSYLANVPPWRLKTLSVRAGVPHAFRKGDSPMVWICFEKWLKGVPVTSVAEDLVLT